MRWRHVLGLAAVVGLAAIAGPDRSAAQSNEVRALILQVEQLRRQLNDLQREYYRRPSTGTAAATSGPGAGAAPPAVAENLLERQEKLRANFESRVGHLTGMVEKLVFDMAQIKKRLDKLVSDADFRLGEIEKSVSALHQSLAGGSVMAGAVEDAPAASASGQAVSAAGAPTTVAAATPPAPTGVLPEGTVQERFDHAFSLIRQLDFEAAERAFKEFLETHPDHELAGNGHFWLGRTYFVRRSYPDAAAAFLDGYNKAPAGQKAADNLLNLGMALRQMGQNEEACTTFAELIEKFDEAPARIKSRAESEGQQAGCT